MDIVISIFGVLFGLGLVINYKNIGKGALRAWYQVHPNKKLLWDGIYEISALLGGIICIISGLISLIKILFK
jgi:hypothetical protein